MRYRLAPVLAVSALFLLVFVCSYLGRTADNNTLFSWAWAFAGIDASRIYLLLVAGLVLAFILSRPAIPERFEQPFLAAVSFAACLPFWRESELIVDASRYFTQAKHLELYGAGYFFREWGRSIVAWTDLPLLPFLYGLIFKISGESRIAVQLFNTALFALTSVLTCRIGKKLWNRETGFIAGLLLIGIPYLLTQVPLLLVDVPTMFFLTLALYAFIQVLHEGGALRILGAAGALALAVMAKYSSWIMLSTLGIAAVIYAFSTKGPGARNTVVRSAAVLAAGALLAGTVLFLKYDVIAAQLRLLHEYQKPGLGRWGESFLSTFLFQTHPFIIAAALVAAVAAIRRRDAKFLIAAWPLLFIFAFSVKRIRYTLPVFPMLALMAGYGLQMVRRDDLRRFISYGIVTSSIVVAVFAYLPLAETMSAANLQRAGRYLNTLKEDQVEVITIPPADPMANPATAVPLLDLFTDKRLVFRYSPESFPPDDERMQSSLRFTWEYRNPPYYEAPLPANRETAALVVISDMTSTALPKALIQRLGGRRLSATFDKSEAIFRLQTAICVYSAAQGAPAARDR